MKEARDKCHQLANSLIHLRSGVLALAIGTALSTTTYSQAQDISLRGSLTATDVADDFTLAAAGDILPAATVATQARNREIVRLLQSADVTMANFEAPAIDLRERGLQPVGAGRANPLVSVPAELPEFLRSWGFDMVGFANNHTVDWGPQSARDTVRRLDAAGIVSAGFGETRSAARAPAYYATAKGRVALVAFTATFAESSIAMDPFGTTPGVPGVSVLRTTPVHVVTKEQFAMLREIDAQHNPGAQRFGPLPQGDELVYRDRRFRVGDRPDIIHEINPDDRADILRNVREAKQRSDFLVVSVHNHEEPNCEDPVRSGDGSAWPCGAPPEFLRTMARAAIDNGADAVVGHGPHVLQGIEIYKSRPIFYSLGNLFWSVEGVKNLRDGLAPGMDPERDTIPEYLERAWAHYSQDRTVFQGVIAVSRFRDNNLAEIRLSPFDIGQARRQADRGFPETPPPSVARAILQRLQRLSEPFGTSISIEGNVGVIRLPTEKGG